MNDQMTDKITPAYLQELAASKWATQGQMQDALRQAAERIEKAEGAIRQAWPYIEEDYNLPNLCTTQGYRDAMARLGRIIGEVV